MGREKRKLPAPVAGGPKERHKRAQRSQYDPTAPVPEGFVAKPAIPQVKHHSYYEFVENKEKKKKLEYKITSDKTPPPGFEFVPMGNPRLTTACKELSREKDAMIFIVSNSKEEDANHLAHQVHRMGHHIREVIVDEARASLGDVGDQSAAQIAGGSPEPIPKSQEEYDAQVDAAIRDLFPRIPNTDRQMIIEHAFRRGTKKGDNPVGLSADITLARRVQLAVLAHIRHAHTRYDTLLKETTWQNARKVVEGLCLDTLVKWRGDEENGRDQLDEILREVVVISDSENDDDDSAPESDDESMEEISAQVTSSMPGRNIVNNPNQADPGRHRPMRMGQPHDGPLTPSRVAKSKVKKATRKTSAERKGQRGFKRYQHAWEEAVRRNCEQDTGQPSPLPRAHDHANQLKQMAPVRTGPFLGTGPTDSLAVPMSLEMAGPAPNENGFVSQASASYSRFDMPPRSSNSPSARPSRFEPIRSPIYDIQPSSIPPSRPIHAVTTRLQDMLVRSIEPVSPDAMKPSFVRALPPKRSDYLDDAPILTNLQHSPRMLSPSRAPVLRGEHSYNRRQVAAERAAPASNVPFRHPDSPGGQVPSARQDYRYGRAPDNYTSLGVMYRSNSQQNASEDPRVARGPVLGTISKPGHRPSRVIMEDRGGFFERVPATEPLHAEPPYVEANGNFRPIYTVDKVSEPRPQQWPPERHVGDGAVFRGAQMMSADDSSLYRSESHLRRTVAEPALIRTRTPPFQGYRVYQTGDVRSVDGQLSRGQPLATKPPDYLPARAIHGQQRVRAHPHGNPGSGFVVDGDARWDNRFNIPQAEHTPQPPESDQVIILD